MIRVVAAIIERPGKVLICQRPKGQAFAGQWEFPGGKMKPSETPRAALERELREELGIQAWVGDEVYAIRHRYGSAGTGTPTDVNVRFFKASVAFGEPRNVCFERIVWARREDLPRYDFLAADRWLVSRLARGAFRGDCAWADEENPHP